MSFLNFRINLLLAELTIFTVAKVILFVGGLCISSSVIFAFQGTPPLRIRSVAWSPDGSMIAVGGGPSQCDPNNPSAFAVQVLDSTTGQLLQSLAGATCSVNSVDWSPDGAKVVAASGDAFGVRVWDIQSGQILMTIQSGGQGTTSVRWHPNGAKLAVATVSNLVVLVDPMTGNVLDLAPIGGLDVDWNPDGSKLVSGSAYDNKIYAADMMVNQEILAIDMELVAAIDWSPDGTKWVTGSADGTVHIWNATSGEVFLTLLGHNELVTSVRWSWDNTQIASASNDGTVRIWDAVTGQQLNTIYSTGRVSAVDWSPDGSQIAFGGIDNTLHIVDPFMFSPTPTFTPTATFTLPPTLTPLPSFTPLPTFTPTPTITLTPTSTSTPPPVGTQLELEEPPAASGGVNAARAQNFTVQGWTLDTLAGEGSGPGVDGVEVFAGTECSGTLLGSRALTVEREDVLDANPSLDSSYLTSGFGIMVEAPESPIPAEGGPFTFTVCARNTALQTFDASLTRTIEIVPSQDVRLGFAAPAYSTSQEIPGSGMTASATGWA